MDTDNITIRPGRVDDAPFIGLVVCMALHYDDSHPFYGIFTELASRTDAQYSYCNALIAEIDGKAAGAIVGYNGAGKTTLIIGTQMARGQSACATASSASTVRT